MNQLKYIDLINEIAFNGCGCPPEGSLNQNITSYRYIFENDTNSRNHLPARKISPKRKLKSDEDYCSACGLSCYNSEENAIRVYNDLISSHPKIYQQIGDSLSVGVLKETDGLIGEIDNAGHFDFYEYATFDPNQCFRFVMKIYSDGND